MTRSFAGLLRTLGRTEAAAIADGILAADFVHADTVLLRRLHALIVIEL